VGCGANSKVLTAVIRIFSDTIDRVLLGSPGFVNWVRYTVYTARSGLVVVILSPHKGHDRKNDAKGYSDNNPDDQVDVVVAWSVVCGGQGALVAVRA